MLETLTARMLHTAHDSIEYPVIKMEDGRVVSMEPGPPNGERDVLTAAFFDVHVHGAMGFDFMTAASDEIEHVGRFLATSGVAHYLPTTVTGALDATFRALETLSREIKRETARGVAKPVGINLEGPFLCPAKRGVHPVEHLLAPSVALFDRFQDAAAGCIRLITVAPEMPGALELIRHAVASDVRVSLGHSNATSAETDAAIVAGATSATHLFNAMRPLDHREPGLTGTVLDRDDLYAEAIVDGVHLHPATVRLWFKMKGTERAILITDGMSAMGMPDGTYQLGELIVEVREGVCLSRGVLAGSVLTLERAVENLRAITGTSLATAVRLASRNPAAMLGMTELLDVVPGSPANFNVFDELGRRRGTVLDGVLLGS